MFTKIRKLLKNLRKKAVPAYLSTHNTNFMPIATGQISYSNNSWGSASPTEQTDKREVKKPVDVVNQILVEQPVMDLDNLDQKIKVVKRRIRVLAEQSVATGDDQRALDYLIARKGYLKYGKLFNWSITTQEKINELLSKYKLMQVSLGGYARNIPNEALDEIEQFALAYEYILETPPEFQLICDEGGPEQKKDPILLARSPFGNWWYVLGAWDKEVEYVDDLIYKGK